MEKNVQPKISKAEQIRVCIRMRPVLPPYEDEEAWGIDENEKKIYNLQNNNNMDFNNILMNNQTNANLNVMLREKEIRRRY